MFVLTFKTVDDREREIEFGSREEAITRMEDILYHTLEYAQVYGEAGDLVAQR